MDADRNVGPDDIAALKEALAVERAKGLEIAAELAVARAKASEDSALIVHQKLQIAKLRHQIYGQRSERSARLIEQLALALEELEADATEDELAAERAVAKTTVRGFTRKRAERQTFPEHLPRERVVIDPRQRTHDWNALNNYWGGGRERVRLDYSKRIEPPRDRKVTSVLPAVWYNAFGGATIGARSRQNYLDRFEKHLLVMSYALDPNYPANATERFGLYMRLGNPVSHPMARTEAWVAGWGVEGRIGAAIHTDRSLRKHLSFGPDVHVGVDAIWMAVRTVGYVDRRLWDNAGTVELGPWWSKTSVRGNRVWRYRAGVAGGIVYRNPGAGIQSKSRFDFEGFARGTAEASVRTPALGVRFFFGVYGADTSSPPPLQRRIMVAGADPYTTFTNPMLRSGGALFVRPDLHYQARRSCGKIWAM